MKKRNIRIGMLSCAVTLIVFIFISGGIAIYCSIGSSFNEDFEAKFYLRQNSENQIEFNSFGNSFYIDTSFLDTPKKTVNENPYLVPAGIRVFTQIFAFFGQ